MNGVVIARVLPLLPKFTLFFIFIVSRAEFCDRITLDEPDFSRIYFGFIEAEDIICLLPSLLSNPLFLLLDDKLIIF